MMQPQAQPQQQNSPTPIQPQAQAGQQQQAPQGKQKPSGREGQPYNPQILKSIEQHLNTVPPEQQQFVSKFMTPELAQILGIIIGQEAYDYFNKFADPNMQLTVVQRQQQGSSPATQPPQQGQQPQGQPAQSAQPQPQSNPPQASIMGR